MSVTTHEWTFADLEPDDELAQLRFFSMKKRQDGQTIEFRITVYEYTNRNKLSMRFFAEADKQTNQKTAPFTPIGWGETLLEALRECVAAVHRFPYEGQ
jgi:hypothetical protein